MNVVLVAMGAVLVVIALADAVMTAGSGGGPLTARLGRGVWRLLLLLAAGHGPSRLLAYGGALVLLTTVGAWVLLLWAGWFLVFVASDSAIVDASTGASASIPATIYFAGFVVFTLGVGDFVAATGTWQVLTAAASFLGLFLITLSITYLISVVSAAVTRRQLAQSSSVFGATGDAIVLTFWDGTQVSSQLPSELQSLRAQILKTAQQHLAYPVLHFFHSTSSAASAPRAIAALDDALVLLGCGLSSGVAPGASTLGPLQSALQHYGDTVGAIGGRNVGPPPLPALHVLRSAGVPVRSDEAYRHSAQEHERRRQALHRIVRSDAWTWPQRRQDPSAQ